MSGRGKRNRSSMGPGSRIASQCMNALRGTRAWETKEGALRWCNQSASSNVVVPVGERAVEERSGGTKVGQWNANSARASFFLLFFFFGLTYPTSVYLSAASCLS